MYNHNRYSLMYKSGYHRTWWLYPLLFITFLGVGALLVWSGYRWGGQHHSAQQMLGFESGLHEYGLLVEDTRQGVRADLDALTHRIGLLQAHVNRLNALGGKMVAMADMNQEEFDFVNVPAMGGAEELTDQSGFESEEITRVLEKLELTLLEKEQQLRILDEMMFSKTLQEEIKPHGTPVEQGWISSHYGYRSDPFSGKRQFHRGIDFAGAKGTSISAAAGGIVHKAERHAQYGLMVEIDHRNGYVTRYAHASRLLVKAGEVVKRGQAIAEMGSTGRSTGIHLHFEVIKDGKYINPTRLLKKKG